MKITTTVIDLAIRKAIRGEIYSKSPSDVMRTLDPATYNRVYNQNREFLTWRSMAHVIDHLPFTPEFVLHVARHSSLIKERLVYDDIPYNVLFKNTPYHPGKICNTILNKFYSLTVSWEEFYNNFENYFSEKAFYSSIPRKVLPEYQKWARAKTRVQIAKKVASKLNQKASFRITPETRTVRDVKDTISIF